jgi:hypothetical protein
MLPPVRSALLLAAVLLLAGCGSSSSGGSPKSAYEHRMAALVPPLQAEVLKGRFALEAVRVPASGRRRLRSLEGELRTAIADLQALEPPADVQSEHRALIAGYQALLADFTKLNAAAGASTPDKLRVEAGRLGSAPGLQAVANALQAIIAKGYDLGFPPGS